MSTKDEQEWGGYGSAQLPGSHRTKPVQLPPGAGPADPELQNAVAQVRYAEFLQGLDAEETKLRGAELGTLNPGGVGLAPKPGLRRQARKAAAEALSTASAISAPSSADLPDDLSPARQSVQQRNFHPGRRGAADRNADPARSPEF